jgi:capsular polysaccharide export protein
VATITSLTGFEALLRGKAVTVFGRPFYAGWGLTDDVDPPLRDRRLTLDELTAASLLFYPSYLDPVKRLPAPPEIVFRRLAEARTAANALPARLLRFWSLGLSWLLNWRPPMFRR